jgi:hypothetical protein
VREKNVYNDYVIISWREKEKKIEENKICIYNSVVLLFSCIVLHLLALAISALQSESMEREKTECRHADINMSRGRTWVDWPRTQDRWLKREKNKKTKEEVHQKITERCVLQWLVSLIDVIWIPWAESIIWHAYPITHTLPFLSLSGYSSLFLLLVCHRRRL